MSTVIEKHLTISEAAEIYGVSRQRMHVLLRDYGIKLVPVNPRLSMVKKTDLSRIPKDRPPGKPKNDS